MRDQTTGEAVAAPATRRWGGRSLLTSEYFVLGLCVVMFVGLWPFVPTIASAQNLNNVLSNMWPLLALAIGQTFVMILAGIDLSQIAILAVTSVAGAMLISTAANPVLFDRSPLWGVVLTEQGGPLAGSPFGVPVAIVVMLAVGVMMGWLNGIVVARFNVPPFMMTLVAMIFFAAFAVFLTRAENITGLPVAYATIGRGGVAPFISYAMMISLGLAGVAHLLLSRTLYGRWLYATGRNAKAAVISGVPTRRVTTLAFMMSGFCAAVGSILYSSRLAMGRPGFGQNMDLLLDIIGATVIGGTSLFGGRGKVLWTVFGVLFFVLLSNALNLLNLSYFTINMVKGGVILAAAFLDVKRRELLVAE